MQDNSRTMSFLMQSLIAQAPYLLTLFVGLIVAVVFLSRHRTPALLVAAGMMVQILSGIGGSVFQAWIMNSGPPNSNLPVMAIFGFLLNLVRAGGLGLVVAAAFVGRGGGATTAPFAPGPK